MANLVTRDERNNHLLREYHAGRKQVLALLFEENERLIKAVAQDFDSMAHDNDDFFSEACLAFVEAVNSYKPDHYQQFGYYAFRCMRNKLRDLVKAKSAGETPTEDLLDTTSYDPTDEIEDRLTLETALAALPDRERDLIQARYYEDLTQDETAENMGISRQRVQQIEARALETMRETLGG